MNVMLALSFGLVFLRSRSVVSEFSVRGLFWVRIPPPFPITIESACGEEVL